MEPGMHRREDAGPERVEPGKRRKEDVGPEQVEPGTCRREDAGSGRVELGTRRREDAGPEQKEEEEPEYDRGRLLVMAWGVKEERVQTCHVPGGAWLNKADWREYQGWPEDVPSLKK
ncbi:hypothetical protein NDU88_006315 [Pleurodeles waltl]|uniref:Uncharacterized protein n=1 Tax=Pleurodeles waltl TaxID=8319 RepID=A0AAV7L3C0_PLEWA|nr:hypothetical protein NDU88_006315 [Pleurodeles waltl]